MGGSAICTRDHRYLGTKMRTAAVAALWAIWAAAASAAPEAAEDFDRFEDNIAMESERQFMTMNFADFTSQFPKTPDLAELLAQTTGLFSEPFSFGKRTGSSSSSSPSPAHQEESTAPETQRRKTNATLGAAESSKSAGLGSVMSQLLAGGQGVEDVHQELSGLLFGDQAGRRDIVCMARHLELFYLPKVGKFT